MMLKNMFRDISSTNTCLASTSSVRPNEKCLYLTNKIVLFFTRITPCPEKFMCIVLSFCFPALSLPVIMMGVGCVYHDHLIVAREHIADQNLIPFPFVAGSCNP